MRSSDVHGFVLTPVSRVALIFLMLSAFNTHWENRLNAQNCEISFQEVSVSMGLDYVGQSFGSSWGDFNGDGFMDVWLVNHLAPPQLYMNEGGRKFINVTKKVFGTDFDGLDWDTHGAAWGDVNNDGRPDFYQCAGGLGGYSEGSSISEANQLFIQKEGTLLSVGPEYGLSYIKARSRTPLWFDMDRDGRLDLMLGLLARPDRSAPVGVFRQLENGHFENAIEYSGIQEDAADFINIGDVSCDNIADIIMPVPGVKNGIQIYDGSSIPLSIITDQWMHDISVHAFDIEIADLNEDACLDIYTTAGYPVNSGIKYHDPHTLTFGLQPSSEGTEAVRFKAGDKLNIELGYWEFRTGYRLNPDHIYLGKNGKNPVYAIVEMDPQYPDRPNAVIFSVDRKEALNTRSVHDTFGVYIGYDKSSREWEIRLVTPDMYNLTGIVNSNEKITDLTGIGFNTNVEALADHLLINNGSKFENASVVSGISGLPLAGIGIIAGDFDNDMDQDLYIVQCSHWGNYPNILLENKGNAKFEPIEKGFGAEGDTWGIGDTPSLVDFDNDGYLDLLVPNGKWPRMLEDDGRTQLFRNTTSNDNHWIEIDLVGTKSNRDGFGAKVYLTTGTNRQVRQCGGMHRHTQDMPRIHFGLGPNTIIDEIEVIWPSGIVQKLTNVNADRIIKITEEHD